MKLCLSNLREEMATHWFYLYVLKKKISNVIFLERRSLDDM